MRGRKPLFSIALGAIIALQVLAAGQLRGQGNLVAEKKLKFQYVAKFVCGPNSQSIQRVLPGWYATAINIHNPDKKNVTFRKKIAFTFPPAEQRPGRVSEFLVDMLKPDEALEVDCGEIPNEFFPNNPPPTPYVKGFLVVQSPRSLDVTAVYTAGTLGDPAVGLPMVRSIDVEQIEERKK